MKVIEYTKKGLSEGRKALIKARYQKAKDLLDELYEEFKGEVSSVGYGSALYLSENGDNDFHGMVLGIHFASVDYVIDLK